MVWKSKIFGSFYYIFGVFLEIINEEKLTISDTFSMFLHPNISALKTSYYVRVPIFIYSIIVGTYQVIFS